jgi:2-polyprenyl-3-methyl-5-hydroxy-6-metoxy-1,4-benzoquinol methylase
VTTYVLDNASEHATTRFASLEACYDPVSTRQLEEIGVSPGWSCLEVGGGGGSIARWLAERVGAGGRVVVTDIDARWLDVEHPNIQLLEHDVASDELEWGAFDLVHERLVLIHLLERERALRRMIDALKPGGWVLIEDFDCSWTAVEPDGERTDSALFAKVVNALYVVLRQAGVDLAYGRRFHSLLSDQGLVDVHVEAHIHIANGGSPGLALYRANTEQLRDLMTGQGLVDDVEIDRFNELLEDPQFSCDHPPMFSGRGRRPLR